MDGTGEGLGGGGAARGRRGVAEPASALQKRVHISFLNISIQDYCLGLLGWGTTARSTPLSLVRWLLANSRMHRSWLRNWKRHVTALCTQAARSDGQACQNSGSRQHETAGRVTGTCTYDQQQSGAGATFVKGKRGGECA